MSAQPYFFHAVWDHLLRVLHWWNAITLFSQIITGSIILIFGSEIHGGMKDNLVNVHSISGYMFAAGVLTRILWLFIGPPTARWRDLLPLTSSQRKVFMDTLRYYASALRKVPPLYLAHNPFAGIIYSIFFLAACAQVVTGVVMLNLPEELRSKSPLLIWHDAFYYFMIFYVVAHLFAVFIHELVERHGLISAMVHGSKTFKEEEWQRLAASTELPHKGGDVDRKEYHASGSEQN